MSPQDMRTAAIQVLGQKRVDQLARPDIPVVMEVDTVAPDHTAASSATTGPSQDQSGEDLQRQGSAAERTESEPAISSGLAEAEGGLESGTSHAIEEGGVATETNTSETAQSDTSRIALESNVLMEDSC